MQAEKGKKDDISSRQQQEFQVPQKITISQTPSNFYQQYCKYMPQLSIQELKKIKEKLEQNGFHFKEQFTEKFASYISSISDNSITYLLSFGHYTHSISVYMSNLQIPFISRTYVAEGKFGKVQLFYYEGRKIIAKVIKTNIQVKGLQNHILQELFLLKFAAVISVGPEFINLYGYDLVVMGNNIQFLMECCDIRRPICEEDTQDLRRKLRILHEFQFIHGDIKTSNIGWSLSKHKFVFLDFGLSKLIREKLGQKSMSQFQGTYDYCYKEMKDAFRLKKSLLVDLYFNDQYGLNKYFKETEKIEGLSLEQKHKFMKWETIVSFFKLNSLIFRKQLKLVASLFRQQRYLNKTFKRLIRAMIDELKNSAFEQQINEIILEKDLSKLELSEQAEVDTLLYCEVMNVKSIIEMNFLKLSFDNIESIIKNMKFKEFWQELRYKKQLFEMMYLKNQQFSQSNQMDARLKFIIKTKELLIKEILIINKYECQDKLQSYIEVLKSFREQFFVAEENTYLEHIDTIFLLLSIHDQAIKTQQMICQLVRKKDSDYEYMRGALSFLEKKSMGIDPNMMWQTMFIRRYDDQVKEYSKIKLLLMAVSSQNKDLKHFLQAQMLQEFSKTFQGTLSFQLEVGKGEKFKKEDIQAIVNHYQSNVLLKNLKMLNSYLNEEGHVSKLNLFKKKMFTCPIYSQIPALSQISFTADPHSVMRSYVSYYKQSKCLSNIYPLGICFKKIVKIKENDKNLQKVAQLIGSFEYQSFLRSKPIPQGYIFQCLRVMSMICRYSCGFEVGGINIDKFRQIIEQLYHKIVIIKKWMQKNMHDVCPKIDFILKYSSIVLNLGVSRDIEACEQIIRQIKIDQSQAQFFFRFDEIPESLLYVSCVKYLKKRILHQRQYPALKSAIKKLFYQMYQIYAKHNQLHVLPTWFVLEILYSKQEQPALFDLLIKIGEALKQRKQYFSANAYHTTKDIVQKLDRESKYVQIVFSWKFEDIAYNPYRVAIIALTFFYRKIIQPTFPFETIIRLMKLIILTKNTVELCSHFRQQFEPLLWYYQSCFVRNKRKKRILLKQYARSWSRRNDNNMKFDEEIYEPAFIQIKHRNNIKFWRKLMKLRMRESQWKIEKIFGQKIEKMKQNQTSKK